MYVCSVNWQVSHSQVSSIENRDIYSMYVVFPFDP